MNVQATHALVGAGVPYRGVRGNSHETAAAGARPEQRTPVEQVIEGELLGRQRSRVHASTEPFDVRLHRHSGGDPGQGFRSGYHNRAAVDVYLSTATTAEMLQPRNRLDIFA